MTPMLPMPFSYELLRERAESLHKHVALIPPTPDRPDVLRIFVRQCLDMPEDSRDLVHGIRHEVLDEFLKAGPGSTLDATALFERRTLTERLLDAHQDLIERCIRAVTDLPPAARAGLPDEVLPALRRALDDVRAAQGRPLRLGFLAGR